MPRSEIECPAAPAAEFIISLTFQGNTDPSSFHIEPQVVYPETTKPTAPLMELIFKELNSRFNSQGAYIDGLHMIEERVEKAASALEPTRHASIE